MAAERDRRLPGAMRAELKRPLGPVMSGPEALEAVREAPFVVAVGDVCALDLHLRGRTPDVAVVDFKTKRREDPAWRERLLAVGDHVLRAENPAGTLTRDLWDALSEAFKSGRRVRIEVSGEDDLAALAAIALAPDGAAVLYGVPDEGVAVVRVDAAARARVADVLARME